jgi:ribosomal protein L29
MKNIQNIADKELVKTLMEKRHALRTFKVDIMGGKSKNVKAGREIKKEVAQILTELTVRAHAAPVVAKAKVTKAPAKAK